MKKYMYKFRFQWYIKTVEKLQKDSITERHVIRSTYHKYLPLKSITV